MYVFLLITTWAQVHEVQGIRILKQNKTKQLKTKNKQKNKQTNKQNWKMELNKQTNK